MIPINEVICYALIELDNTYLNEEEQLNWVLKVLEEKTS